MKLSISLLLPALAAVADAAAESAKAYIFLPQAQLETPTLTPAEARLVIAQRLDISKYHQIGNPDDATIDHINSFGGLPQRLFSNVNQDDMPFQLVVMVDGWPERPMSSWKSADVAFEISSPPSQAATKRLVNDLSAQISPSSSASRKGCSNLSFDPYQECWGSTRTQIIHVDIQAGQHTAKDVEIALDNVAGLVRDESLEILMILIPKSSGSAKHSDRPYGIYDMPSKVHKVRTNRAEEPLSDIPGSPTAAPEAPLRAMKYDFRNFSKPPIPFCYRTYNICVEATEGCSGHGACYLKYNTSDRTGNCYACGCEATYDPNSNITTYWGGAACSKVDISAQFWLLAGFSIILIGLVAWAVGMMFSIGEEKLPSVIGAGVSGPKAR